MPPVGQQDRSYPARAVLPAGEVRIAAEAGPVTVPCGHGGPETQIELIESGGVVQAIDVKCSCGQRIRLLCQYD